MKKPFLLLLLSSLILPPSSLLAWTITNFNATTDTSWASQVVPKLNNNYNNLVGWLDADDLTNGYFLGAIITLGSLSTNTTANFAALSNQFYSATAAVPSDSNGNGHWGTNEDNLVYVPSLYYGANNAGLDNGGGGSYAANIGLNGFVFENAGNPLCDFAWAAIQGDGNSLVTSARFETRSEFVYTGGSKELQFGWSANYTGGLGWQPCLLLGDNYNTSTMGFSVGEGWSPTTPPPNGLHVAGNVQFDSQFSSDGGAFYSDGSGNVTAQTFTPVSDRSLKENIQPMPSGVALGMVLQLTNYQWNFRARTNYSRIITRAITTNHISLITTNLASATNAATLVTNTVAKASQTLSTNLVPRIIPASGKQFGPMAQDWHKDTGLDDGRHISVTALQGLLLGAVQDLNQKLTAQSTAGGNLYASNNWSLAAITNSMPNFSIWQGNSNGFCLVTISLSNGVVRYLQALR